MMTQYASQDLIFKTLLKKPALPSDVVVRQRLFDQLNSVHQHNFTLICAPAGYGKSTLISNWLETISSSYSWLSLNEELNDYYIFLSYLAGAVQGCCLDTFRPFAEMVHNSQNLSEKLLLAVFCDDLYETEQELIIILDDYHLIDDPRINRFIMGTIENAPEHFHLVMTSRWNPALPLSQWRARGQMMEIRGEQLLFQKSEIQSFFELTLSESLSEKLINSLSDKTEGWIACLRLIVLSMQAGNNPETVVQSIEQGVDTLVSTYLLDQIFSKLPREIQDFLEKTSILYRLNAGLCDAMELECCTKSQEILDSLIDSNLFLTPLDHEGRWYRYHHLIKDDLQIRLKRNTSTKEITNLHLKAARWLAEAGIIEQSIQHFISGGDLTGAAVVIENKLLEIMETEDRPRLERWLKHIPEDVIHQRPYLLLAKALILTFYLNLELIPIILENVEDLLSNGDINKQLAEPEVIQGLLHTFWSQSLFWSCDWQAAIRFGRSGMDKLPKDYYYAQGLCVLYQSIGMKMLGQGNEAIACLEKEVWGTGEPFNARTVRAAMALSVVYTDLGYLHQAVQVSNFLVQNSEWNDLPLGASWGHYFAGRAYLEQGELDQALYHFKAVSEASYRAHIAAAHECFLGLAIVYQFQGAPKLADSVLDSAEALALETGNQRQLLEINSFRARLALMRNEVETAFQLMVPIFNKPLPSSPFVFIELPHFTLTRVWIASGEADYINQALVLLDQMIEIARSTHNVWRLTEFLLVRSLAHYEQGNTDNALGDLQVALKNVKQHHLIQLPIELSPAIQNLVAQLDSSLMTGAIFEKIYAAYPSTQEEASTKSGGSSRDLTEREIEVLELFGQRLSYDQVAHNLVISPLTVKTHARNIYKKLGVSGRREAVALARQIGLLIS